MTTSTWHSLVAQIRCAGIGIPERAVRRRIVNEAWDNLRAAKKKKQAKNAATELLAVLRALSAMADAVGDGAPDVIRAYDRTASQILAAGRFRSWADIALQRPPHMELGRLLDVAESLSAAETRG